MVENNMSTSLGLIVVQAANTLFYCAAVTQIATDLEIKVFEYVVFNC